MIKAKAAVFDLGNVLLNWQPEAYYDAMIGPDRRRAFFASVPIEAMNDRSDLGESLTALVDELATDVPIWANEIRMWRDNWLKICAPAIQGSVDILQRLKNRGVPVYSLTNFGDETFGIARAEYTFLDLFDQHFVSARLGMMKPDPNFYAALEHATGLSGAEIVFADDRADNIEAAQARGWTAHHFTEPAGWERALIAGGLL